MPDSIYASIIKCLLILNVVVIRETKLNTDKRLSEGYFSGFFMDSMILTNVLEILKVFVFCFETNRMNFKI